MQRVPEVHWAHTNMSHLQMQAGTSQVLGRNQIPFASQLFEEDDKKPNEAFYGKEVDKQRSD